MVNRKYGKVVGGQIKYAPYAQRDAQGRLHHNPSAALYAANGYLPVANDAPSPPEGMAVSGQKWASDGVRCFREYTYSAAAEETRTRRFSKLKLYAALSSAGLWEKLMEWLDGMTVDGLNAKIAFILAQELDDSHPMFTTMLEKAKETLGVPDEQVEAILSASEVDE
ncbi:MAG: hypothetical protein ACI305_05890 [Lepagella sp.]